MSLKFTRRLVSQEDSAMIARPDVPRSKFHGSWTRKATFNAGFLVPFMVEEVLPGDMLKYDVTAYVRMATPLYPLMDNQRIDTFFFFVPNRLVWSNWVKFMGEQNSPSDTIAYTIPQVVSPSGGFAVNTVYDHMGLPCAGQITAGQTISVNTLPLRMYNLIYQQWFKDENLINSPSIRTGDTGDVVGDYSLFLRAKSADYFTSSLPWPQKFTAPTVALSGNAAVSGIGFYDDAASRTANTGPANFVQSGSNTPVSWNYYKQAGGAGTINQFYLKANNSSTARPEVFADLSTATGVDINALRQAFLTQQLLERDARGGTRYTEIVKSHFGVTSPDARLQRPEYIGGGSSPFNITPVANTSQTGLGALGGAGTAVGQHRASYASTEHGFIIGLINVKTELSYQQGLHRMWTRNTRYDYYWPSLAGLGEQAVLRQELYCTGTDADDVTVFGYQERWHEYRTRTSEVTGQFRSTTSGTLDAWHLSQRFTTAPTLGQTFIQDDTANILDRALAAGATARTTPQQYLADILIRREAVRPLPTYGTPVSLGRF